MIEQAQSETTEVHVVRRKLFFGEFQVLRAKRRVFGKELPENEVLVKLRVPGHSPIWERLDREVFNRGKYFCAVPRSS